MGHDSSLALLHRLNGQLLRSLETLLTAELSKLGTVWDSRHWIINVILLHRSIDAEYSARLETSATLHRGDLIASSEDYDKDKVAILGLPVPLDGSFSGHAALTSDVVWISDLEELEGDDESGPPKPGLSRLYREFGHVGVTTPANRPTAEFVFPIQIQVGMSHLVIGVVNMEFFNPEGAEICPFNSDNQLLVSDAIAELLNLHGPYLLIGHPRLVGSGSSSMTDRLSAVERDVQLQESLRSLHEDVLSSYVAVPL